MPGTYSKRRHGLKPKSPRAGVPLPGVGGYDYPRGPFGATGFPGSTPAARTTHTQTADGRRDRQLTASGNQAEWALLPPRRADGTPRQPRARTGAETSSEHRMTPVIGGAPGSQNVRNSIAQRYKARPALWRGYRPSPNPGKTGARLNGPSQTHPGTMVYGHPDGVPVPGMASNPGFPPEVTVQSRFVSAEGSQEGYAMDRDLAFARGGVAGYPSSFVAFTGNQHLRGGRLTGERYFGAIQDQQEIGLPSDAYGIARARGPRHRPVRFEQPQPWSANYYDNPPDTASSQAADMIHQSPSRPRSGRSVRRGGS
jgi:hypothetical protein